MTTVLHISAGARGDRSLSRKLSGAFIDAWLQPESAAQIITRDV